MRDELVLLTGVTGFIARAIARDLLLAGYRVRGSVRSDKGIDALRAGLRPHLPDPALLDRLSFTPLDLGADDGWPQAMEGVSALVHTASPFPIAQPRNADDLIRPAVDGTLRALRAARDAGVTRVVLTSSVEAIMHGQGGTVSEKSWSDLTAPTVTAYTKSKTLAERAAWDFVAEHPAMRLTAINPGLVLGTPIDAVTASSVSLLRRLFSGRDPVVPDFTLPVVDLADVAALHVAALSLPGTEGRRYPAADRFMSMLEMAQILKTAYPDRRIATRRAPKPLLRLLSLFDADIRMILPSIGKTLSLDNAVTRRDFAREFIPADQAVLRTAAHLVGGG